MMYNPLTIVITLFLFCLFIHIGQNVENRRLRYGASRRASASDGVIEEVASVSVLDFNQITPRRFVTYILDSGVRTTHSLFANVTIEPAIVFESANNMLAINETELGHRDHIPGHGHGTFTASMVAKASKFANITIVPLVVVNSTGFGQPDSILKAVQFAIKHHQQNHANEAALIVMSLAERKVSGWLSYLSEWLGAHVYPSLRGTTEQAWKLADDAGMFVITAAGNWGTNNCARFMSDFQSLLIVGARTTNRTRAEYSNFGSCISLFDRGEATGASGLGDNETTNFLGTSVSAPLVAQAVIRYWTTAEQTMKTRLTASQVYNSMMHDKSVIDDGYITDLACSNVEPENQAACQSTVRKALIEH